ncbi:MAG: hypothetical protein WKF96_23615 [Solirubrobacteraceae bacterium]
MIEDGESARPEDVDSMPTQEGAGDEGLGSKSGGVAGSDDRDTSAGGDRPEGGEAEDGPVKGETSEPGGGDATGPTPSGVPQEGGTNPDADTSTGST